MSWVLSTEAPHLTAGNFENTLASDNVLAHFFNKFLRLQSFPESLQYNKQTGLFEVVSGGAESVARRIRQVLQRSKSFLADDPTALARTPQEDNRYSVCCLDREQGIQWIMKERLPFFLQSDCYCEYRLAKLLLQWDLNLCVQRRKGSSGRTTLSAPQLSSQFHKKNDALKVPTCSHSQVNILAKQDRSCECKVCWHSADVDTHREEGKKEKVQEDKRSSGFKEETECLKKNWEVGSRGADQENVLDISCHGIRCHSNRPYVDEFKEFLQGKAGEKLLNFWMDIERLRATHSKERRDRYLVRMRSWYLQRSSQRSLNAELLSSLGLTISPCWTEDKLRSVQHHLTESLLYYWAPRFWSSQCVREESDASSHQGLCEVWCVHRLSGIQPHHGSMSLPSHRPDTCLPQSPYTVHTQLSSDQSQLLDSRTLEKMLQALCVESCAGFYLTNFCEQSENQLWENAVNFWTDLQHYRELFCQDGLNRYRVQREAQHLYYIYLSGSARRSIGVDEEIRREVYDHMMPASEELFDKVEEHTLNILLEPWTLLVSRDNQSFQQVCVQEEVRSVDSQEYRELQSLYEESERRLKQVEQCWSKPFPSSATPSTPHSMACQVSDSWANVSPDYQGYRLGSLFRHHHETEYFMSFLQSQEASTHLTCWFDLEQYRRTPKRNKDARQERSSHIVSEYLNTKYFFGPDSPATTEQQNDILRLAGGLERLKMECLSNPVVVEIQHIVKSHIEKKWLPLFLSTAEFMERQRHQPKPQAADRLSQHVYRQRRTRRQVSKAKDLWMSSTVEIMLFRRTLLNPVTCMPFQHFVSLKGGFQENDVCFWLEVQRYKDLCHSHSDEATIQQKISTIINCFINSSVPPALQIDIPPEQAQHVLEKRHQLGPYIFREAQTSVFSELLKFWPEFQELSSSIPEEQLLPLLQEKRDKHRARVRRQRRKEEEEEEEYERRRAQEELERAVSRFEEEEVRDDEDEVEEQEEGCEKKQFRTPSRELQTPTQALSWCYSKYMAALKREEVLLRRQSQLEASFSTASDSSSDCSVKSASSKLSRRQLSCRSSRMESKQCNRQSRNIQQGQQN